MTNKTEKPEGPRWERVYAGTLLGVLLYAAAANYAPILLDSSADVRGALLGAAPVFDSLRPSSSSSPASASASASTAAAAAAAGSRKGAPGGHHRPLGSQAGKPGDITVVAMVNAGMMDFAVNWLHHLHRAVGKEQVAASLLLYVVGEEPRERLLESGLVREENLRDGTVGMEELQAKAAMEAMAHDSPGAAFLNAQRPRILLEALEERSEVSRAVLYSDLDAVWRQDPFPVLLPLLSDASYEVACPRDARSISGGFVMFRTGSPVVRSILRGWRDAAIRKGTRGGTHPLNDILEAYQASHQADVFHLDERLFPSGREFFRGRHRDSTPVVVHTDHLWGLDKKRKKLKAAGVWIEQPGTPAAGM